MLRYQKTYARFFPAKRTMPRAAIPLVLVGTAVAASCSHDWESYDPRLGDRSSGTPDSSSSTISSSSGMGSGGMGGTGGMGGMGGMGMGGGITCVPDTGKACYTGPQGTENQGACKGGATLCQADGMSYGPCLGEVTPIVEECTTTTIDDDCNGMVNDHCGIWAMRAGTSLEQRVSSVVADATGNILITGQMYGSADFGGGVLTSAGGLDIFVAKFDKDGKHLWSNLFGGPTDDEGLGIAVDAAGNSFITGSFTGTMTVGAANTTAIDAQDGFVIKLDPTGQVLGFTILDGLTDQRGHSIAIDGAGDVIVTGTFTTELNTTLGKLTAVDQHDGFVVKYKGDLAPQWQKAFGGSGNDEGTSVTTDTGNHVYLTGTFDETVDFGGGVISDGGSADVFLAKLDAGGNHVLSKGFPSSGDQYGDAVRVDAAGNIYLAGDFNTAINMGAGQVASQGGSDLYVTKLDSAGMHQFTKTYGDAGNQYTRGMTVDYAGDIIIVVSHEGAVDYGGGRIANAGGTNSSDVVVFKLKGATGAHAWSRRFGNSSDQDVRCVAADSMNNLFVGGDFGGSMNFGSVTLSAVSGDDAFLVKFPP